MGYKGPPLWHCLLDSSSTPMKVKEVQLGRLWAILKQVSQSTIHNMEVRWDPSLPPRWEQDTTISQLFQQELQVLDFREEFSISTALALHKELMIKQSLLRIGCMMLHGAQLLLLEICLYKVPYIVLEVVNSGYQ